MALSSSLVCCSGAPCSCREDTFSFSEWPVKSGLLPILLQNFPEGDAGRWDGWQDYGKFYKYYNLNFIFANVW